MITPDNITIHAKYKVNPQTGEIIDWSDRRSHAGDEYDDGLKRLGLSPCHNTRKKGLITVYKDGSLLEVTKNRIPKDQKPDTSRGEITGFSKKSRLRFIKRMGKVKKTELPLFITLTYPENFPSSREIYKADLEKFLKRLVYRFPKASGFWRLEFQKRGAPHYHLLVWGLPGVLIKKLISKIWFEVVRSGDEKHLKAGTNVQQVRSWRGVMYYSGKYMAKCEENDLMSNCGRVWGSFNIAYIPWSEVLTFEVSQKVIIRLMRLMRKYAKIKARDFPSLSILVNNPERWIMAAGLLDPSSVT